METLKLTIEFFLFKKILGGMRFCFYSPEGYVIERTWNDQRVTYSGYKKNQLIELFKLYESENNKNNKITDPTSGNLFVKIN